MRCYRQAAEEVEDPNSASPEEYHAYMRREEYYARVSSDRLFEESEYEAHLAMAERHAEEEANIEREVNEAIEEESKTGK